MQSKIKIDLNINLKGVEGLSGLFDNIKTKMEDEDLEEENSDEENKEESKKE